MHKAYLHNKIRVKCEETKKEKNENCYLKTNEDSLTASFFGLLFYFPKNLVSSFFEKILEEQNLGNILYYEFWPHWSAEGTTNKRDVEPDLFIRFENLDLIVEVKKLNISITEDQIKNEQQAYKNEYSNEKKKSKILVIADNFNCNIKNCKLKTWRNIAFSFYDTFYKTSFDNFVYKDLTDDILTLLSWHGIPFAFPNWETLLNIEINYDNSIKIFQDLSEISE